MRQIEQVVTTVEIADMMGVSHKSILQKLEGANRKGKHTEGIIEILNRLNFQPVDFFIESQYTDAKGECRKCYKCTRKGCEFLAHKFTGQKGIEFTARYINRFHDMENAIKQITERQETQRTPQIQEHSNTYLLPISDSWFNEMNDIFERVCQFYNWKRNRLYHEILNELNDRYDIQKAIEIYKIEKGESPKYIMDVVEWFPQLRDETVRIMKRYESVLPF